jgi:hypothetical protein
VIPASLSVPAARCQEEDGCALRWRAHPSPHAWAFYPHVTIDRILKEPGICTWSGTGKGLYVFRRNGEGRGVLARDGHGADARAVQARVAHSGAAAPACYLNAPFHGAGLAPADTPRRTPHLFSQFKVVSPSHLPSYVSLSVPPASVALGVFVDESDGRRRLGGRGTSMARIAFASTGCAQRGATAHEE